MAHYRFLNHDELAELIRSKEAGKDYQVVDVRGENEFEGGYITGAINQPSDQRTEQTVTDLVDKLQDVPKVIFHCALSQVRGPKAAGIYAEARQKADLKALADKPDASVDPTTSNNSYNPFDSASAPKKQEVLVLRDGFEGWQSLYKKDSQLVDKYNEEIRAQLEL